MKATTGATAARCSWADIVKGTSETAIEKTVASELPQESSAVVEDLAEAVTSLEPPQVSEPPPGVWITAKSEDPAPCDTSETLPNAAAACAPLKPGSRGGLQCLCRGQVLNMLSHYGWITAFGDIDHPLAGKHFGRVYIHSKDVVEGHSLSAGDVVSFYLYVDNVGLGAESCRVEHTQTNIGPLPTLRKEAAEFVPGGAFNSAVPVSGAHGPAAGPISDMFVRMSRTFNSIPANGYVQMAGAINSAYFDSDSDSEDEEDVDADRESLYDESDHSCGEVLSVVQKAKYEVPTACKDMCVESLCRSISPGMTSDSTNAGLTSDSETEGKVSSQAMRAPPGLCVDQFRPPPGLRLPPGLEDLVPIYGL